MRKELLYRLDSLYREDFKINGVYFGNGEKAACIVGAMRGDEVQQMYCCARLIEALRRLEQQGKILPGKEILVVPSLNHTAMNTGKRFWPTDNTDINRMFPGYALGETTQRVAAGIFENIQNYQYGIHFTSLYMSGDIIPHIRILKTSYEKPELAAQFGLPYVVLRAPRPFDTTTLNYNWQIWNAQAYSIYTTHTNEFHTPEAKQMVDAVLRFLAARGIVEYSSRHGYITHYIDEPSILPVQTSTAGLFRYYRNPGDEVLPGDLLADIIDPFDASIREKLVAPIEGTIFFRQKNNLINENAVAFKMLADNTCIGRSSG